MMLEIFSVSAPKSWPKTSIHTYEEILSLSIQMELEYTSVYPSNVKHNLIELSILSLVREKTTHKAEEILSKLDIKDALQGYAMVSFHCQMLNIDCSKILTICDSQIKKNTDLGSSTLSYIALNKFLLNQVSEYEHYTSLALAKIEDFDTNNHKWAFINLLLLSNRKDEAWDLVIKWKDSLSTTFGIQEIWYNLCQYDTIETMFQLKDLFIQLGSSGHNLYKFFISKILKDKLADNLEEIILKFGEYGSRMVFPVLNYKRLQGKLTEPELSKYLSQDEVESFDSLLLIYAIEFPSKCRDFIHANSAQLFNATTHSYSDERMFNYGKISSLTKTQLRELESSVNFNYPDYFAGLAYYSKSSLDADKYLTQAIELFFSQEKGRSIDELTLIIESSIKIDHPIRDTLVNAAIQEVKDKKEKNWSDLGKVIKSLSKMQDFSNAYKVYKSIPAGKRAYEADDFLRNLCIHENYDGLFQLLNELQEDYNSKVSMLHRTIITLNNFRGSQLQVGSELTYSVL